MEYSITDQDGATLKVDAENWLLALGMVLPAFDVDVNGMGRITCVPEADGSVFVDDSRAGRSWLVREVEDMPARPPPLVLPPRPPPAPPPPPPEIKVMASARSAEVDVPLEPPEPEPPKQTEDPAPLGLGLPPPSLAMPVRASFEREAPQESLAERLFDLSMDLSTMEPDDACRVALELVTEFVPCEAASVVRGTLDDDALTFVAATGPVADRIIGRQIPFGEGIVGLSYDARENIIVRDVGEAAAHLRDIDEQTGFRTRAALCVPILADDGNVYGVIELLNPTARPFGVEDEEAVETIARTLAGALAFR